MIDPGTIPIFGKSRRSMDRGNVVSKLCASILGMVCGDIACYFFLFLVTPIWRNPDQSSETPRILSDFAKFSEISEFRREMCRVGVARRKKE